MKLAVIVFIGLVLLALALMTFAGGYLTWKSQKSPLDDIFAKGALPKGLDGFYAGKVDGYNGSWRGKVFDAKTQTGINRFEISGQTIEHYSFDTYSGKGLQNRNTMALKIDYNRPGNPWWVKFVLDEVVEIEPGNYIGKIHLRIIPGLPFTVGYFKLSPAG